MIQFMYSGGYTDTEVCTSTAETSPKASAKNEVAFATTKALVINTKVYIIGEKYMVPNLKEFATKKFETALVDQWNSKSFADSLRLMFDETLENDRMLKDVAIKYAGKKARQLVDRGEFATLLKEKGEIGFEIFKVSLNKTPVKASLNMTPIKAAKKGSTRYVSPNSGKSAHGSSD